MAAFNLPQENIIADYMIGEKKLSVLEYGDDILVEIEVEDSINKCVSLDVKKWKYFCDHIEQIQQSVRQYLIRGREGEYMLHLGNDLFLSVKNGVMCVDFRKWFKNSANYMKPLKNGVALTLTEFEMLSKMLPEINEDIPDLETIIPCQYTHNEEMLCDHCKPSAPFES